MRASSTGSVTGRTRRSQGPLAHRVRGVGALPARMPPHKRYWQAGGSGAGAVTRGTRGFTFEEAFTAFGDPLSLTVADPDHSYEEA